MTSGLELIAAPEAEPYLDHAATESARLIRAARHRLVTEAGAITLPILAERRRSTLGAARQWAYRQRMAQRLISVRHANRTLIPAFQLDDRGDVDPEVAQITAQLIAGGLSNWAVWRWFSTYSGWVAERPVEAAGRGDMEALQRAARALLNPL